MSKQLFLNLRQILWAVEVRVRRGEMDRQKLSRSIKFSNLRGCAVGIEGANVRLNGDPASHYIIGRGLMITQAS